VGSNPTQSTIKVKGYCQNPNTILEFC